ncbi:MAG: aminoacyl-tRNA hydrolase [Verrucomicrobiae bacterium]|nr:aminoacyl-tRNA hydrolase [Verrucomicrobiae bacterium]
MTKLIIGLGNPGREYDGTRHNIGFRVADALAERLGVGYKSKRKFLAEVAETKRGEMTLLLARPLTYMNLSGQSAAALREWYKCELRDVFVMYDDADLDLGRLRVRGEGSSGGHKGMQSIIDALGTSAITRLRLGVGRSDGPRDGLKDHVLSRFDRNEEKIVKEMVVRAVEAVESWLDRGLAATMNEFNSRTKEIE